MKSTKNIKAFSISSIATLGFLRMKIGKIDLSTKTGVGGLIGLLLLIHPDRKTKFIGAGILTTVIVNALVAAEKEGGLIAKNNFGRAINYLKENGGIELLNPEENTEQRVDGLTYSGLNAVYKVGNGISVMIDKQGLITETSVFGALANRMDVGGLKGKKWCEKQAQKGNDSWLALYKKSI